MYHCVLINNMFSAMDESFEISRKTSLVQYGNSFRSTYT